MIRVIPCLLLHHGGLVKTVRFKNPVYVGDPINAVKIFNDKEVDELMLLDIDATREGRGPNLDMLARIAREAFMPMAYGGGIRTLEDIQRVLSLGFEKVVLNTALLRDMSIVERAAERCGGQSVVAAVDVKKDLFRRVRVYEHGSRRCVDRHPVDLALLAQQAGAGEIIVTSVDREGTGLGYDTELVRSMARAVSVPVIANGGAGKIPDLADAVDAGASAVAAGSLFVFHGPHRAVLITYPNRSVITSLPDPNTGSRPAS